MSSGLPTTLSTLKRPKFLASAAFVVALVVGALTLPLGRAEAHGVQVSSNPAPNSQVAQSPKTITVNFSEAIEPSVSTIQLWDQSAKQVPLPSAEFPTSDHKTMTVSGPSNLPPGIYTVIWRNLSTVDGHTWAGSFPFTVLGPGGAVPKGAVPKSLFKPPSNGPSSLDSAARWIVLLGSAVMLGGTAYVLFIVHPSTRRVSPETGALLRKLSRTVLITTTAIAVFFVLQGSLLQLISQADKLGGLGKADDLLRDTRSGHFLIARQGLLAIALLAVFLVSRARSGASQVFALGLLLLASVGVLLTLSLVSHSAAASDGSFWTSAVDIFHLLAAALWIGMLVHIGLAMPRWLDELKGVPRTLFAAESFRRFSLIATVSVVVIMASGVLSALVQFTAWSDLWTSSYGWSLVAKMALMLPLLAMAGLNAFYLGRRVEVAGMQLAGSALDDPGPASQPTERLQRILVNTVRIEAVLAIMVLVAVAVLTQLEPPRAAAQAQNLTASASSAAPVKTQSDYIQKNAEVSGLIMVLRVTPGKIGENQFDIGLGSEFGGIGEVQDVRLDFVNKAANTGQSRLALPLAGSAKFSAKAANLSLPGDWTITAIIRRLGIDDVRADFTIPIAKGPECKRFTGHHHESVRQHLGIGHSAALDRLARSLR